MKQSQWSSRLGYILAAAGSAVGLGAIWKFPYVTAANGGGAFLLVFLLFSFTLGVAVLMGETLLGSMSRRGNCHDNAVAESFFQFGLYADHFALTLPAEIPAAVVFNT